MKVEEVEGVKPQSSASAFGPNNPVSGLGALSPSAGFGHIKREEGAEGVGRTEVPSILRTKLEGAAPEPSFPLLLSLGQRYASGGGGEEIWASGTGAGAGGQDYNSLMNQLFTSFKEGGGG
mmetsp:Transcript_10367/g.20083  ORF Transcript_10367/g.20083 Transcript_10367/m.20083 type:complete len:121 (-) Transcript_10367:61-423(-)